MPIPFILDAPPGICVTIGVSIDILPLCSAPLLDFPVAEVVSEMIMVRMSPTLRARLPSYNGRSFCPAWNMAPLLLLAPIVLSGARAVIG